MKRAAKAGIVVAGVVAVGLAGAITLNATQTGSQSIQGVTTPVTASATPSASAANNAPSATPSAATSTPAANASPSAAPSSQAPAPAPTASSKPEASAAPVPAPAAPAPGAQGLDGAGIQRIEDICTARLRSDAARSGTVTGTVVPRPYIVVSIAFSGAPVRSTGASGLPAYDVLMKTTLKLADAPAQNGQRVCRVYDADAHVVDWLPAG
ncbi:hypothetical protein OOZ51_16095 [Arthrobacter sp. MI7-26]|uniref:hypothetical protein n=1 Tax=Arthrobacter sp. MI7-26 TaxID=2993653 RepID=UPI0022498D92|nr:hypothetical protein [Arthrobacter sp. MI7-26]MCX2749320.1 hypothetical protein [Arthrobacter sp. MI7-26]